MNNKLYIKDMSGSTAIEFSLLAMPFLILIIGIIEISIMLVAANLVEGATGSAARAIKTGQIQQNGGDPEVLFREALCRNIPALVNCNNIIFEVITINSFSDYGDNAPNYDGDGAMVPQGFNAGGSSDIVIIRTFYQYKMMTPFLSTVIGTIDGNRNFVSTVVMQTEPYEFIPDNI